MKNILQSKKLCKHNTVKSITSFTALFFLMFIFLAGCSNSKSEELQNKVDDLSSQYEELQDEYKSLDKKYQDLLSEHETLQAELEQYQDQQATINDLNAKLTELQGQYDALQTERDNLLQQLDAKRLAEEQAAQAVQQQALQQVQSEDTVYWTPNGECYHSTPDCSTLKRSKNISSGTVEQSGRRPCKVCH